MNQLLRNILLCMGVIVLLVGCSEKDSITVEKRL